MNHENEFFKLRIKKQGTGESNDKKNLRGILPILKEFQQPTIKILGNATSPFTVTGSSQVLPKMELVAFKGSEPRT